MRCHPRGRDVNDRESTHSGEALAPSSGVLRLLVEGTAAATGEEFFRSLLAAYISR